MESEVEKSQSSRFCDVGSEGSTSFTRGNRAGDAVRIDADHRRIHEIAEALRLTGLLQAAGHSS